MSDPDLSLRIDAILGRLDDGAGDPAGGLLHSARTLVDLDDRDRGAPSQHFRARLKGELFTSSPAATTTTTTAIHKPQPPKPTPLHRKERRMSAPRVLAIAASLLLLLGGMGVVFEGPLRPSRAPEPSAIPAASFATPAPIGQNPALPVWTAPAPGETGYDETSHLLAGGRIFRAFGTSYGSPHVQAIDAGTGEVLWEQPTANEVAVLVASNDVLVIANQLITAQNQDAPHDLVGLDAQTGVQRWQVELASPPVAAVMMGDRVLVLGWDNTLDAIGIEDGQPIYSVGIGGNSQPQAELPVDVYPMSYAAPGHMAVIGDIVAVVLADGSVAAVDGNTGTGLWWTYRSLQGPANVFAVGNRLVISILGTYVLPLDGRPLPPAATPASSDSPLCQTAIKTAPEGTHAGDLIPPDYSGLLYGVDPATGSVVWSGITELFLSWPSSAMLISEDQLLLNTAAFDRGTTIPGEWCAVDVDTGKITLLSDPPSVGLGSFINSVSDGRIVETITIFANGKFVADPAPPPADATLPTFDLSPYVSGAFYWVQIYDGAIYVSMGDGTLMKLVASG